jgi:hypothetical protein
MPSFGGWFYLPPGWRYVHVAGIALLFLASILVVGSLLTIALSCSKICPYWNPVRVSKHFDTSAHFRVYEWPRCCAGFEDLTGDQAPRTVSEYLYLFTTLICGYRFFGLYIYLFFYIFTNGCETQLLRECC